MSKKEEYIFGGVEECEFELSNEEEESNLLLRAYARIPAGEGVEGSGLVDFV